MRIARVDIKDFRSIAQLSLEALGPAVIFYGRNGSGKSNVITAIQVACRTLQRLARQGLPMQASDAKPVSDLIRADDFRVQGSGTMGLGITLEAPASAPILVLEGRPLTQLAFRVVVERRDSREPFAWCSLLTGELLGGACDLLALLRGDWHCWESLPLLEGPPPPDIPRHERAAAITNALLSFLTEQLYGPVFRGVADIRHLGAHDTNARAGGDVLEMLAAGDIKGAFAAAHQHERAVVRDRFAELRRLLSEAPLSLPLFDPVRLAGGGIDVQARIPGGAVSIDLVGLGVLQLFSIIASIALSPAAAIAIEEPEAHLHAPTSGRALRMVLAKMLEGEPPLVHQLFVATHSNLFDLDQTGYYHVELDQSGTTQVTRRTALVTIDRDHLWEPGPARHALEDVMHILPEETTVAHHPNGTPVKAREMIQHLQMDDDIARQFCQDVVGAAVRAVRVRASSRS